MHARTSAQRQIFRPLAALFTIATLVATLGMVATAHTQPTLDLLATSYFNRVMERGDLQSAANLLHDDAVLHTPEGTFQGPEGAKEFADTMNATFDNLDFQLTSFDSTDDMVVIPFTLTGINVASYEGMPANCAAIAVQGVALVTIVDGAIAEQWISYDQGVLRSQIDAFNQIDVTRRPSCASQLPLVAQAVPTPDVAQSPSCHSANTCRLPY